MSFESCQAPQVKDYVNSRQHLSGLHNELDTFSAVFFGVDVFQSVRNFR